MVRAISFTVLTFFVVLNTSAHDEGHDHFEAWIVDGKPVLAEFLKFEDEKVYMLDQGHELLTLNLSQLSPAQQKLIVKRHIETIEVNHPLAISANDKGGIDLADSGILIAVLMLLVAAVLIGRSRNRYSLAIGVSGCLILVVIACSKDDEPTPSTGGGLPSNDLSFMQSVFSNFSGVSTSSDDTYFYVSSNGLPDHNMMVGITNWQQQVPIDHDYTGNNSWAIPIHPELADNPLSTQTNLLKGAIAIAANGIPIFNPLNNRGEDANAIGELDQWGGHCGRADDYHYHLPPTHLQSQVGSGNPIAYAVDGFPVYGETTDQLDQYLGKFNDDGSYQYHTVQDFPYFIAGMRGKVTLDPNTVAPENQVIPQASTAEVRPALTPLAGAVITDFQSTGTNAYSLTYSLNNENYMVNYNWDNNGLYTYVFINPDGTSVTETYQR